MSIIKELKAYLINENDGFLMNDENNGKTIILSGVWGVGKTYFWQHEIESILFDKLREENRACIYISLYGKDNLKEIKEEVFFKASQEKDYLSEEIEVFGFDALSTIADGGGDFVKGIKAIFDLNKFRRNNKGKNKLKNGGIICFDDFERKSKNIDLNDLFGFISQLAISLKSKVIIILNSDVFKGQEANIFKTVKEKTVNKYLYYNPTTDELFKLIFYIKNSEKKYKYRLLRKYKTEILNTIKELKVLNARVYIQILDNCLEWMTKRVEDTLLRELTICTVFFIKHHYSLGFMQTDENVKDYEVYDAFLENIELSQKIRRSFPQYTDGGVFDTKDIIHSLKTDITKKKTDNNDKEQAEIYYSSGYQLVEDNKYMLKDFYHYIYILKVDDNINSDLFNDINKFIKTGILSSKR